MLQKFNEITEQLRRDTTALCVLFVRNVFEDCPKNRMQTEQDQSGREEDTWFTVSVGNVSAPYDDRNGRVLEIAFVIKTVHRQICNVDTCFFVYTTPVAVDVRANKAYS